MKIYLKVKYEERNIVKSLGATWDYVGKAWYVDNRNADMSKFSRFMHITEHLSKPHEPTRYEIENRNTIKSKSKKQALKDRKAQNMQRNKESMSKKRRIAQNGHNCNQRISESI